MSKIIKLSSENVKRLQAVEITPEGHVVVIGGRNGQGKSSVLDSIQYALGGEPPDKMPVRRGEDKARIVLDLGDIVVKRTITAAGGGSLIVTNADGVKQSSPQTILDKLTGKLTFDPLDFSRQKPEKQAETLRGLVGLDFTKHDAEAQRIFDERTAVNREVKALQARLAAMPSHADAPAAEVSAAAIMEEQRIASEKNSGHAEQRRALAALKDKAQLVLAQIVQTQSQLSDKEAEITRLQREVAMVRQRLDNERRSAEVAAKCAAETETVVSALKDIDLTPFQARAAAVEADNRKVRENAQREAVAKAFKTADKTADELTRKLEAMDAEKRRKSSSAKYPIEGLMFDTAGGVTLNGIPFNQCSSAEQLKVSVAIGLALNPKLKVLLIRDGSLLDDDSMKLLAEMAKAAEAQVWLERVGTDANTSVVIEDGHVKEAQ